MKTMLIAILLISIPCFSQSDAPRSMYADPIEINGTPFVVSYKTNPTRYGSNTLVFVNTANGVVSNVELPDLVVIKDIKNFQAPELGINVIFVTTVSKTSQKSSVYNRFFVLSADGTTQNEIPIHKELINQYRFNATTGRLTFFLNRSSTESADNNEQIMVFDLKTLRAVH